MGPWSVEPAPRWWGWEAPKCWVVTGVFVVFELRSAYEYTGHHPALVCLPPPPPRGRAFFLRPSPRLGMNFLSFFFFFLTPAGPICAPTPARPTCNLRRGFWGFLGKKPREKRVKPGKMRYSDHTWMDGWVGWPRTCMLHAYVYMSALVCTSTCTLVDWMD